MHYFFTWTTGHTDIDVRLQDAVLRWEQLAVSTDPISSPELVVPHFYVLPPEVDIPPDWASTFYILPHAEQVILAFTWLHWWQQSSGEEEPGFSGWLRRGPGFALNHVSLLKVLTENQTGALGILHGFLELIVERAGDWNGDREARPEIMKLLEELSMEYRYNVHGRELWPAVLQLIQTEP